MAHRELSLHVLSALLSDYEEHFENSNITPLIKLFKYKREIIPFYVYLFSS